MADQTDDKSKGQNSDAKAEVVGPPIQSATPKEKLAEPAPRQLPPRPERKSDRLKKTTEAEGDQNIWRYSRRGFLEKIGWVSIFSFFGVMLVGSLRFMFPRVLFEPSPIFRAGFPQEYLPGSVSTKWIKDFRVWIIRESDRIYALSAICTHLGCTPRWLDRDDKFKCPCHGSGFYRSGVNFEGPAPRALERLKIAQDEEGEILVDRSVKFLYENDSWDDPHAYLNT